MAGNFQTALAALFLAGSTIVTVAAQEPGLLVPGVGAEATYTYCVGCHSAKLIVQQGLDREGWEEVLNWMVEEQDMEPLDEPERGRILEYLTEHYNVDRPNYPTP